MAPDDDGPVPILEFKRRWRFRIVYPTPLLVAATTALLRFAAGGRPVHEAARLLF